MKHTRIVIAALFVAIAFPAAGAQSGAVAPTPPPIPPEDIWSAPTTFTYPSKAYWSNPENVAGFLGTYEINKAIEPDISQDDQLVFKEVIALMELGQKQQALNRLLTYQTANPNVGAAVLFNIGNINVDLGKFEEAIPYYKQAIAKFGDFYRAHKVLGIVYCQLGRFEEAIPPLLKTINLGHPDSVIYGLLGLAFNNTGQLMAAESAYRNAMVFEPGQQDWKVGLVQALMDQQKYTEAIALLDELIQDDPTGADLWMYQANAFLAENQVNKAAGNYEIVRRMGEVNVDSLLLLGRIYLNENLKEMALDVLLEAIEKGGPASVDLSSLVEAARIMVGSNSLDEGARLLTEIEQTFTDKLTPDDELLVLKLRSQIAIARGESEEAAKILQQVVDSDPFDGEALNLLAAHFRNAGEIAKAEIYYERAAKVRDYRVNALINHAQMLVGVQRYGDALPLLDQAYQAEPSDALQRYIQQVRQAQQSAAAF